MPVVDLDRISKSYSSKVAVRELSLSGGATQAPVLVMIWERR